MDRNTKIAVVGGGAIGASLAVLFTGNGYHTVLLEKNDMERSRSKVSDFYKDLVENGLMTEEQAGICLSYLNITSDYLDISDAGIIFESVPEILEIKHQVYREIEGNCNKFEVLASVTSAISADQLAEGLRQKEKLVVAHPFYPAHMIPCVEVVQSIHTSKAAVELALEFLKDLKREVVLLKKNKPGFIANRLQYAMLREAIYIVEQGIASPEDVDRTLMYSFAPRYTSIGIFEHFDNCGLDLTESICSYLYPHLAKDESVQNYIDERCRQGKFGIKSGEGVYDWKEKDLEQFRRKTAEAYLRFFSWNIPKEPEP